MGYSNTVYNTRLGISRAQKHYPKMPGIIWYGSTQLLTSAQQDVSSCADIILLTSHT